MQNKLNPSGVHEHAFHAGNFSAERGTFWVALITAVMMVIEILAGWWYNSMALLADGWHMSSHTLAIGLSAFAYMLARKYAKDSRFAFGTWKIEVLSGFASALFLMGVAIAMIIGSVERILRPENIHYQEAIGIAMVGLLVNLVCAMILGHAHQGHDDKHGHSHEHDHNSHHHAANPSHDQTHHTDLNLKSAYIHVLADALTSVLAVIALLGGMYYGWSWLDPCMGIVGALLVALWAKNLIAETVVALLDREMDHPVVNTIREQMLALPHTVVTDLHVWRVGRGAYSCAMSLSTEDPTLSPPLVKERLAVVSGLAHATIEIHRP